MLFLSRTFSFIFPNGALLKSPTGVSARLLTACVREEKLRFFYLRHKTQSENRAIDTLWEKSIQNIHVYYILYIAAGQFLATFPLPPFFLFYDFRRRRRRKIYICWKKKRHLNEHFSEEGRMHGFSWPIFAAFFFIRRMIYEERKRVFSRVHLQEKKREREITGDSRSERYAYIVGQKRHVHAYIHSRTRTCARYTHSTFHHTLSVVLRSPPIRVGVYIPHQSALKFYRRPISVFLYSQNTYLDSSKLCTLHTYKLQESYGVAEKQLAGYV